MQTHHEGYAVPVYTDPSSRDNGLFKHRIFAFLLLPLDTTNHSVLVRPGDPSFRDVIPFCNAGIRRSLAELQVVQKNQAGEMCIFSACRLPQPIPQNALVSAAHYLFKARWTCRWDLPGPYTHSPEICKYAIYVDGTAANDDGVPLAELLAFVQKKSEELTVDHLLSIDQMCSAALSPGECAFSDEHLEVWLKEHQRCLDYRHDVKEGQYTTLSTRVNPNGTIRGTDYNTMEGTPEMQRQPQPHPVVPPTINTGPTDESGLDTLVQEYLSYTATETPSPTLPAPPLPPPPSVTFVPVGQQDQRETPTPTINGAGAATAGATTGAGAAGAATAGAAADGAAATQPGVDPFSFNYDEVNEGILEFQKDPTKVPLPSLDEEYADPSLEKIKRKMIAVVRNLDVYAKNLKNVHDSCADLMEYSSTQKLPPAMEGDLETLFSMARTVQTKDELLRSTERKRIRDIQFEAIQKVISNMLPLSRKHEALTQKIAEMEKQHQEELEALKKAYLDMIEGCLAKRRKTG